MDGGRDRSSSVELPLTGGASQSQPVPTSQASAPADDLNLDDLDEEDLFGSAEEDDVGTGTQGSSQGVGSGAGPSQSSNGAAPRDSTVALLSPRINSVQFPPTSPLPTADLLDENIDALNEKLDEKDLFGDDDADVDEKDLFGSDDEGGIIDEKELFGSDDEGDVSDRMGRAQPPSVSGRAEAAAAASARPFPTEDEERSSHKHSEASEMDEREIFGDVSDDEPEKVEDVILRRRPAPSQDRTFMSLRLPNVLSTEKTAFCAKTCPQSLLDGCKTVTNTLGKEVVKLLSPENCIRWRFKKGPDGQNLTDEDGRPQYESNARIVEWEDGSRTLFVGAEAFNISEIEDEVLLFEENSQEIHVCHGVVRKRLVATPRALNSSTHDMLKRSQFRKYEPTRRSVLISADETVDAKNLLELETEHRKKQQKNRGRTIDQGNAESMTAAFLEDDMPGAGGSGPSVLGIKKSYKEAKKQKTG